MARYESLVAAGSLHPDPAQADAIQRLSELRTRLQTHAASLGSFFEELDAYQAGGPYCLFLQLNFSHLP